VISQNVHRRHLSTSQRTGFALDALPFYEQEARERQIALAGSRPNLTAILQEGSDKGEAAEQVGKLFNVSPRYIYEAKAIAEKAPELLEEIKSGDLTVSQAKREIKEREREGRREENRQAISIADVRLHH
jgi:hypothetical protein